MLRAENVADPLPIYATGEVYLGPSRLPTTQQTPAMVSVEEATPDIGKWDEG